jgi:DNA-binding MarR family transcriptional regulator
MMTDTGGTVPLSAEEHALIKALRPAMAAMTRALDEDLRGQGLSHTEYIVLMFLSEAPNRTKRLGDLAGLCQQSPSAIGRTVQRLQAEGLVVRQQCTQDARSFRAVLTDAGLARLEQAWPVHINSVRRHLLDRLEGIDLGKLATAFQRIADTA